MLKEKRHYLDISPSLSSNAGVFEGDTPYKLNTVMSFQKNDNLMLSSIQMSVHAGAHADAPCHYHADGQSIESRDLNYYMGDCQIIEIKTLMGGLITPELISEEITSQRVLFKTGSYDYSGSFQTDFMAFAPETIKYLASKEVVLVGIDTPSIDPATSKDLKAHSKVYQHDMAILECLDLSQTTQKKYELIAIPMALPGADASPVRAILLEK